MRTLTTLIAGLIGFCLGVVAAPAFATGPIGTSEGPDVTNIWGCILFEHGHFAGSSTDVTKGMRQLYIGDDLNDKISSIACRSGCVLTTYQHRDFDGDWHFWRGNVAYVGDDWNDRISSLTVDCSEAKQQSHSEPDSSPVLVPEPSSGPSPFGDQPPPTPGVEQSPEGSVGKILKETQPPSQKDMLGIEQGPKIGDILKEQNPDAH